MNTENMYHRQVAVLTDGRDGNDNTVVTKVITASGCCLQFPIVFVLVFKLARLRVTAIESRSLAVLMSYFNLLRASLILAAASRSLSSEVA